MDKTTYPAAIKYMPTKDGIKFYIKGSNVRLDGLSSLYNNLSKSDVVLAQLLNQLIDYEQCKVVEGGILVPYSTVAGLETEQIEILGLPDAFPFDIEIKSVGNLANKDFQYDYVYLNGASQPFINPKRLGALLEITSEQTYLLLGDQFHLVEAMDVFNDAPLAQKAIRDNLLQFSRIKGLAKETGATLDNYLSSEQVISPSKLTLRLRRVDKDTVEIEPVFCEEVVDTSENILDEEPSEGEDKPLYNKSLLTEEESKSFINTFDKLKERNLYAIKDGLRLVLDEGQKNALGSIKRNRHVKGKDIKSLLDNPEEFFDPDVIDFDKPLKDGNELLAWSERVIEIGEYRPRVFTFVRPNKESWLPPEEGGIVIDGKEYSLSQEEIEPCKKAIENAIKDGRRTIPWKDGVMPANKEVVDAITDLENERKRVTGSNVRGGSALRVPPNVLIIRDNFDSPDHSVKSPVRSGDIGFFKCLLKDTKLFKHQEEGIAWLQNLWIQGLKGAILADDMGLGKTLQALVFMGWVQELLKDESNKPMLIVAPVVLLSNWRAEYEEFLEPVFGEFLELHGKNLRELKNMAVARKYEIVKEIEIKDKEDAEKILTSGRGLLLDSKKLKNAKVVLTTYETLRDYQFSLGLIEWSVIVLDETQKIKSPSAMVTTAVKAMKYDFGLSLTGTPVENSWVDLWSIMDFVQPGHLGSLKEFAKEFHNPLGKADDDKREILGKKLKNKVDQFLLRRMKEDHLDGLPEKKINVLPVEMPKMQIDRYMDVVKKAQETLLYDGGKKRKEHILKTIGKLRDISLHPDLPFVSPVGFADFDDEEIIRGSARLKKTIEILDQVRNKNEKAIIFVINQKMQGILKRIFERRYSIKAHVINGKVPGGKRKSLIDSFQRTNGFNVIILSPAAAGVGLNITSANHVIHLGRAWNPAKEDQATDRVYRIGQKKTVNVYLPLAVHPRFDSSGSFDEKLHRLLEFKRHLSKTLLIPAVMGQDDWEDIIKTGSEAPTEGATSTRLNISNIDRLEPTDFENAVAAIYRKKGHQVQVTPLTNDQGADVVVFPHGDNKDSFLIQCKHTINPSTTQGSTGVKEINAAYGIYAKDHDLEFEKVVVTNSIRFTSGAQQLADANNVKLIQRDDFISLLDLYPVVAVDI